jgi:hypothetical protein
MRVESVAGWLFGLSVTVLLLSVWGRAVVVDDDALGESLLPLARSAMVVGQVGDWLEEELVASGLERPVAESAVAEVVESEAFEGAAEEVLLGVVDAAAGKSGAATVDIAPILSPAVPVIADELAAAGVILSEDQVRGVISGLDPLVIRDPREAPVIGPRSRVASRLGTATAIAVILILVTGAVAVRAANDPLTALRRLLSRIALGGLSFGIMLRVGAWVLDPSRGRAPLSETLSSLANSKWMVPVLVGAVAAALSGVVWGVRHYVRRAEAIQTKHGEPIRQEG